MHEPKLISPLLDGLEYGACVQSEGSKSMYLMRDSRTGTVYLLRIFSVPESEQQINALIYSGAVADRAEALRYYTDQLLDLRRELETIHNLADWGDIQSQVGYQIEELPDGQGYCVYLLSEYLPNLSQYLEHNQMSALSAMNLGIDLCKGLSCLHEAGYLMRNLSYENILVTPKNQFLLANLSLAALDRLDFFSIADNALSPLAAPELYALIPTFHTNSDLYSLGLVLYSIFNGNHSPFVDEETSSDIANQRRLDGEALPAPMYADYELSEILLKACAFDPSDRYQTPEELKTALTLYMQRNAVSDEPIIPPIVVAPEDQISLEAEAEGDEPVPAEAPAAPTETFAAHLAPQEPLPEEPAAEPPVAERKKKSKVLPIAAMCAVLFCGAAVAWYFLRPPVRVIESLTPSAATASSVTVSLQADRQGSELTLVCSDAYGNVQRFPYQDADVTFDGLMPDTQYAITVEAAGRERLTGQTSLNITTLQETAVQAINITALDQSMVTLQLSVNGVSPEQWLITCESDGIEPMEHRFSGNSIQITGLNSNTSYVCTFTDAGGKPVSGETSIRFTTEPLVVLETFTVTQSSPDAVTLGWSYSGDRPDSWTVRCEGDDGTFTEQQVSSLTATFDQLSNTVGYTFTITSVGMEESSLSTLQFHAAQMTVQAFTAEAVSSEQIDLNWTVDEAPNDSNWTIFYYPSGCEEEKRSLSTDATSLSLTELIPQTGYTIALCDANGNPILGDSTLYVFTKVADKFKDYGLTNAYIGLYEQPEGALTINKLTQIRKTFSSGEGIVIAIEAISGRTNSNDTVRVAYVIRNSDGVPVRSLQKSVVWNEYWNGNVVLDVAPAAPEQPGDYTMEVFLNGKLLLSTAFTMLE